MKKWIKILLIIFIQVTCLGNFAQADLTKLIQSIIYHPSQQKVIFSINVINASSGEIVYSHNSKRALIPASNMKIIVTAAALRYLGPDYLYTTKVVLYGDTIVIIGSGDPLLGDRVTDAEFGREQGWIFKDIIASLKQNGVTAIKDIIIDSSIFDDMRVHSHWPKKDLNRWYACEVSGLNFNCNCVEIMAKNIGNEVIIYTAPETKYVKIINKVVPVTRGKNTIGAYRNQQPNEIIVRGKCKEHIGPIEIALEKPAVFFAFLLAENLTKAGIQATGKIIEKSINNNYNLKILTECNTPITKCLKRSNKNSLGLAAEALLKTIAAKGNPDKKNGSWDKGQKLISEYLLALGVDEDEFYIDDGSGLSKQNKLSANAITTVLLYTYESENWEIYKSSLAVGGVDGTISKYFKDPSYKGKIFGKTGYIKGAKSFSGVCSTTKGYYIFSILANNANSRTRMAINDIAEAIIDYTETKN